MKKLFTNKKGFSMIELMVVVAIIGVLAAIGIPQYSKFQAKARQSEAKLSLAALFTAEESFRQEWNQFTINLKNIGFAVQGSRLRYKTGFTQTSCTSYTAGLGAPNESGGTGYTWSDDSEVNTSSATWTVSITAPSGANTACTNNGSTAFTATAYGNPASSVAGTVAATGADTWTINEKKLIQNTETYLGQ